MEVEHGLERNTLLRAPGLSVHRVRKQHPRIASNSDDVPTNLALCAAPWQVVLACEGPTLLPDLLPSDNPDKLRARVGSPALGPARPPAPDPDPCLICAPPPSSPELGAWQAQRAHRHCCAALCGRTVGALSHLPPPLPHSHTLTHTCTLWDVSVMRPACAAGWKEASPPPCPSFPATATTQVQEGLTTAGVEIVTNVAVALPAASLSGPCDVALPTGGYACGAWHRRCSRGLGVGCQPHRFLELFITLSRARVPVAG
jgi:hypothetical protein